VFEQRRVGWPWHSSALAVIGAMKHRVLDWLLMILAAALVHVVFRYWAGDFQGYLTFPVAGADYGFAHIKSSTVWVSEQGFTHIPGVFVFTAVLASLAWLVYEVRMVYRRSVHKR
jgi:hypothetical protein